MHWRLLHTEEQINEIQELSKKIPCLIFKHSTNCSISQAAKWRLEREWSFSESNLITYYLDVLSYRAVSSAVAEVFSTHHETPQVLLIRDAYCTYDASHSDISVEELKECYYDSF
ncbi:MAG: bacillithiol system redox-active protein YtxJ [Saprospiraceae bacterium]|nr:bacillithiol system redox-active protein YtxJ [Saprospiraceae bacterium]